MKELQNYFLPEYCLNITPASYPLCNTKEEAIEYLKIFLDSTFGYSSNFNYDVTDYMKLIYIELKFQNNLEIQDLLKQIKEKISNAYILKNNYLKRIMPECIADIDLKWRPQEFISIELPQSWHQYLYTTE